MAPETEKQPLRTNGQADGMEAPEGPEGPIDKKLAGIQSATTLRIVLADDGTEHELTAERSHFRTLHSLSIPCRHLLWGCVMCLPKLARS